MLKVTIEFCPASGGESYPIFEGVITNDGTGTEEVGNYDYKLQMPYREGIAYQTGRIEGWPRLEMRAADLLSDILRIENHGCERSFFQLHRQHGGANIIWLGAKPNKEIPSEVDNATR
mgnify:CR=1 FL=1